MIPERTDSAATPRRLRASPRPVPLSARAMELGLCLVLFAAPLPFGAVRDPGRTLLEISIFALLLVWLWHARSRGTALPSKTARLGLLGLCGLAIFQLAPLGSVGVSLLSPESAAIFTGSASSIEGVRATISVAPGATASAARTGAALVGLFLIALTVLAECGGTRLALAALAAAGFQGLYGIVVLTSQNPHIWNQAKLHYLGSATGTFVNRNHYACFLAMTLAWAAGWLVRRFTRHGPGREESWIAWLSAGGSRTLLAAAVFGLGLAGLFCSFSRAGVALGAGAIAGSLLAASSVRGRGRIWLVALLAIAFAVFPSVVIDSDRLVERYARSSIDFWSDGGRATVWADTLRIASEFPLFGSGFGSFASAYPLYRSPEVRLFYAHAHNDLLQFIAEGGLLGLLLLVSVLLALGPSWWFALRGRAGNVGRGMAFGLTALALHSMVDFNLHIPANACLGAMLAGGLCGLRCRRS